MTMTTTTMTTANMDVFVRGNVGYLRESRKVRHRDDRQEEIPGTGRLDGRSVRLRHSKAHQTVGGKGHFHLRRRGPSAHRCSHVKYL